MNTVHPPAHNTKALTSHLDDTFSPISTISTPFFFLLFFTNPTLKNFITIHIELFIREKEEICPQTTPQK